MILMVACYPKKESKDYFVLVLNETTTMMSGRAAKEMLVTSMLWNLCKNKQKNY
jgi:hypothetical protein